VTFDRRGFTRALLTLLAAPVASCARSAPSSSSPHRELYLLEAADRAERLLAGAKQEGVVALYTSLNTQDSGPLTAAFEKKYGIRTELWRSSSERVIQRAISEARARRFAADVFETNGPEMEALHREGVLEEFRSPHFADLPEPAFPAHRQWVADRFNFFTIGYNTNLVPPAEVPGSYEDLVHPRFAGRIGL
jgi:iron(III) transport system substrate-binding protein